jgi:hypothetical protein
MKENWTYKFCIHGTHNLRTQTVFHILLVVIAVVFGGGGGDGVYVCVFWKDS